MDIDTSALVDVDIEEVIDFEEEPGEDLAPPFVGNGVFDIIQIESDEEDDEEDIPEKDPLSFDVDESEFDDDSGQGNQGIIPVLDLVVEEGPSQSQGQGQLWLYSTATMTSGRRAVFQNLDLFRCFICRQDFHTESDMLRHRTKTRAHVNVPYNSDIEKPFCCGICERPWMQPRKALACAVFGHDPSTLQWAMFNQNCPECPEEYLGYPSLGAVGRHWQMDHPEKPVPAFFLVPGGREKLPMIKLGNREFMKVHEDLMEQPGEPLVIESFPLPTYVNPKMKLKAVVSSCSACKFVFVSKDEKEAHVCLRRKPGRPMSRHNENQDDLVYSCLDCNRKYQNKSSLHVHQRQMGHKTGIGSKDAPQIKNHFICTYCGFHFRSRSELRIHLLKSIGKRCKGLMYGDSFPYKCMICGMRYGTHSEFKRHRSGHNVPYYPMTELPFECGICMKPTFLRRDALLCALFGHDPTSLQEQMFKHKCSKCPNEPGFHSKFALRNHWEGKHPDLKLPLKVSYVTTDKPLPKVTISFEQAVSLNEFTDLGSSLVKERELLPVIVKESEPTQIVISNISTPVIDMVCSLSNEAHAAPVLRIIEQPAAPNNSFDPDLPKTKEQMDQETLEILNSIMVIKEEVQDSGCPMEEEPQQNNVRLMNSHVGNTLAVSGSSKNGPKTLTCKYLLKPTVLASNKPNFRRSGKVFPKISCKICGQWFRYKCRYFRHLSSHSETLQLHDDLSYPCSVCKRKYHSLKSLRSHQLKFRHKAGSRDETMIKTMNSNRIRSRDATGLLLQSRTPVAPARLPVLNASNLPKLSIASIIATTKIKGFQRTSNTNHAPGYSAQETIPTNATLKNTTAPLLRRRSMRLAITQLRTESKRKGSK